MGGSGGTGQKRKTIRNKESKGDEGGCRASLDVRNKKKI